MQRYLTVVYGVQGDFSRQYYPRQMWFLSPVHQALLPPFFDPDVLARAEMQMVTVDVDEAPFIGPPEPPTNDVPEIPAGTNGVQPVTQLPSSSIPAGEDLRDTGFDFEGTPVSTSSATPIIALAMRILLSFMGRATVITAMHWNRLPGWVRTALSTAGLTVGSDLAVEGVTGGEGLIPGRMLPGNSESSEPFLEAGGMLAPHDDIPGVHLGAHIVGSWVANGVTFYRLSDGRLAVMNKRGRWKVWKPKKPIVIMPTGAINLKTLIRADAVLNRQAKKLAAILNRRAPRPRSRAKPDSGVVLTHPVSHPS